MRSAMRQAARAAFIVGAMALAMTTNAYAQKKYTFGYDQPKSTAYGIAGDIFNAKLMELSKGTMGIDQFPGAQLGQEPVMLQKIRTGDIDFIITSTANASSVAPQAGVFSLHFIFRDKDHLAKTLADPGVSKAFRDMIKDSVQGAQVLGLLTMGLRNMYSKKEIGSVADIKGQKIRVQATKTEDTHFPAYGAQTVHMPFGEVYTSLQTGVVNIAENGTASPTSRRPGSRPRPTKWRRRSRRSASSWSRTRPTNSRPWASRSSKTSTRPASSRMPNRSRISSPRSSAHTRSRFSNSSAT